MFVVVRFVLWFAIVGSWCVGVRCELLFAGFGGVLLFVVCRLLMFIVFVVVCCFVLLVGCCSFVVVC